MKFLRKKAPKDVLRTSTERERLAKAYTREFGYVDPSSGGHGKANKHAAAIQARNKAIYQRYLELGAEGKFTRAYIIKKLSTDVELLDGKTLSTSHINKIIQQQISFHH